MKKTFAHLAVAVALFSFAPAVFAGDARAELKELMEKINQTSAGGAGIGEAGLAEAMKAFDALLATHKGEKTDDVAAIAFMKMVVYAKASENGEKTIAMLRQIPIDFPGTKAAKQAQLLIAKAEQPAPAAPGEAPAPATPSGNPALEKVLTPKLVVSMGQAMPDFAEKDLEGKPLSIASRKGRFVLVDFWATANGTRVGVENEVRIYEKFHSHGFEIIGVSLDTEKDKLTKFLLDQRITWPQFFDGQGWKNKVSTQYGINRIPANYLLDREGKVIASDINAPDLDAKLDKALTNLDVLLSTPGLWSMSQEEFARSPNTGAFQWTSAARDSARATGGALSLYKLPVVEAVAYFERGKLSKLETAYYTRGDSRTLPPPDLITSAENALSQNSGDTRPQMLTGASSVVNAKAEVWYGSLSKYVLQTSSSASRLEFVRVVLTPHEERHLDFKLSDKNENGFNGFFHVKRNTPASGDVLIPDVPMVDQGEKGYCAVACAERVFRYFQKGADANEVAQLANSDPETGTNGDAMFNAIKKIGGRLKVKVTPLVKVAPDQLQSEYNQAAARKKLPPASFGPPVAVPVPGQPGFVTMVRDGSSIFQSMDAKTLKEARTGNVKEFTKFQANIRDYIEKGIPLVWAVRLGLFPEPNVPQSGGNHMRLIIGYNSKTNQILFTDSWGAGHELKRMPFDNAMAITLAMTVIEPDLH